MRTHELVKKMLEAYYSGPESVPSIAAMKKALAVVPLPEWRPIETAPKDGSLILGYFADGETAWHFDRLVCRWISDLEMWSAKGVSGLQPTHWQPLPEPPKEQG